MAHREDIRAYLEGLEIEGSVIDWGCGAKPVMKYVQGQAEFHTIDNNPKCDPDRVWDITVPVAVGQADHAFCMEVLEHVKYPDKVLQNIYANLKVGGTLHLSVPFLYPVHGDEDYWRFTHMGLAFLASEAGLKVDRIWEITDGYLMEAYK